MRILVTGANGFVGSHLCERLLKEDHEVYALVRTPAKIKISHQNLHLIQGDLNDQACLWQKDLPSSLHAVIHTAGIVHSFRSEDFFAVNTHGTERLVNILKNKFTSPITFILISSLAAAGPSLLGKKKLLTDLDAPVSSYGLSKKHAEEFLLQHKSKNWTTIIIRPPMVIGPRDTAVLDIFKMVKSGVVILPDMRSRKKEYSFVCVFDLIDTIVLSLSHREDALFYSAHESIITFEELIYSIQKEMQKKRLYFLPLPLYLTHVTAQFLTLVHKFFNHQLRLTPDKIKELFPSAWTCDTTETIKLLKQDFQYSLAATIKLTYDDYKKNLQL
jgi:nucleoside-diphosphate-sugar epimerase